MKFIKSINEYLSSEKITYTKHLSSEILKELNKYVYDSEILDEGFEFYFDNKFIQNIIIILNNYKIDLLEKEDLLLVIDDENENKITCIFKETKIREVKPQRYVYHQTDKENIDDILKDGLKPKESDGRFTKEMDYPPAIFASNSDKLFYDDDDTIVLKIDTTLIQNIWWVDLNFYNSDIYIMTFEPIPPSAISIK